MLIFNTTYHVEDSIDNAYLDFMKTIYIPQVSEGGFLFEARLAKIHPQHEETGKSYSLQFKVKNIDTLNYWLSGDGSKLNKVLVDKFGSKVASFITILQEIEL